MGMSFLKHPVVLISIGGAMGANARYWLGIWLRSRGWSEHFPLGTFVANLSGCLLLAVFGVLFLERAEQPRRELFLLFGTGFCGAYTTFSTFELETLGLIRDGRWPWALLNVLGSVIGGFIAVVVGVKLAERLL